jgi:hypothetical protein
LIERHLNRSTVSRSAVSKPVKHKRAPRRNGVGRMRSDAFKLSDRNQ